MAVTGGGGGIPDHLAHVTGEGVLVAIRLVETDEDQELVLAPILVPILDPTAGHGAAQIQDPIRALLTTVINKLNFVC